MLGLYQCYPHLDALWLMHLTYHPVVACNWGLNAYKTQTGWASTVVSSVTQCQMKVSNGNVLDTFSTVAGQAATGGGGGGGAGGRSASTAAWP